MGVQTQSISWHQQRPLAEVIKDAQSEHVDYLIVESQPKSTTVKPPIPATTSAELIVFRDSAGTQRWGRLGHCLPASIYFLAALPADHSAIAISVRSISETPRLTVESRTLSELVIELSTSAAVSFVDDVKCDSESTFQYPPLSLSDGQCRTPWMHELIEKAPYQKHHSSSTAIVALKAGLFLLNDFFEESHSCSQSIEGLGPHHTGDYWHAILHRREPDYGNAKYWFRHVGRHPSYVDLAQTVNRHFGAAQGRLAPKLQQWKTKLITNHSWDPFAFVDLCSTAESDSELRTWCEQVQYDEMLLLLESTGHEVFQTDTMK